MKPLPKEVLKAMKKVFKRETKQLKNIFLYFLTYRCPKSHCCFGTIPFQACFGLKNPYAHLRSCYKRGKSVGEQDKLILGFDNVDIHASKTSGGSMKNHFKSETITEMDKAIEGYNWLIFYITPLRIVDSPNCRSFIHLDVVALSKTVIDVIIKVVEPVENIKEAAITGKRSFHVRWMI